MKKTLLIIASTLLAAFSANGQCFIQTTDGKCYWTDDDIKNAKEVECTKGLKVEQIPVWKIAIVENIEKGVDVRKPEAIKEIPAVAYDGNFIEFIAPGRKVYVPVASKVVQQRHGAMQLSKELLADDRWEMVGSAEQADFIVEYVFVPEGQDKAYIRIKDRMGNTVARSKTMRAADWVEEDAGKESAEKLYSERMQKELYKGDLYHWETAEGRLPEQWFAKIGFTLPSLHIHNGSIGPSIILDGTINYKLTNSIAIGAGLMWHNAWLGGGPYAASLTPFAQAYLYFTKHWNPTYFRFRVGWPSIPLASSEDEYVYRSYYYDYTIPAKFRLSSGLLAISYGRQWRHFSLDGGIMITGYKVKNGKTTVENGILPCILNTELSYKIPIKDPQKLNIKNYIKKSKNNSDQ